jgi:hypothetical protein
VFKFDNDVYKSPEKLTPAVLQACGMLNMYQAELASVLGLQCADIGRMSSVQQFLIPGTIAWERAVLFIRFYQCLFEKYNGDEAAMVHWLRGEKKELNSSPLLLMVDNGQLLSVFEYLSFQ